MPLLLEQDDWGRQLSQSLDELEASRRAQLIELFQWFDAAPPTKPSGKWLRELDARLSQFELAWLVPWISRTLARFEQTEWGQYAAAPGVGAFPGHSSGAVLLGLLHISGRSSVAVDLASLRSLACSALTVVPGCRMRAQSAGMFAIGILLRDADSRDFVRELAATIKNKPVRKAIEAELSKAGA